MLLHELLDLRKLQEHLNNGTVGVHQHPTLPLLIYNYTQEAQHTKGIWGDDVIDYCRGLIVHESGEIIARPFKKFHNLNTGSIPETNFDSITTHYKAKQMRVTEKMDGSLGIFWRHGDNWGVATRGSFVSDQANWATNWFEKKLAAGEVSLFGTAEFTPLFEIVYPENRIVVKYDYEGLVLLAMVNKRFGYEMDRQTLEITGSSHGFVERGIVKDYGPAADIEKFAKTLPENESNREGYVLTFDNNQERDPLKVKVKFEDYLRIHKMVTMMGPKAIWELLSHGVDVDMAGMPEHVVSFVQSWADKLIAEYDSIYAQAKNIYDNTPALRPLQDDVENCSEPDYKRAKRKRIAAYFKQATTNPAVYAVCFLLLDNASAEEINELIWDAVKPRGDDMSFRRNAE